MAESNLGCGPLTVKYLVFIFNLLFFISGLILIIVGGIAQGFFKSYIQFFDGEYVTPAIGLIILGTIILIVSFFGCCGAKKENVFMLRIFSFLMVVILVCEISAGITVAILKSDVEEMVKKNMNETMEKYGFDKDDLVVQTWDDLQRRYHCCGTEGYEGWQETPYGSNKTIDGVPDSCCKDPDVPTCGYHVWGDDVADDTSKIYTNGCYNALYNSAMKNIGFIIGGTIALALLQVAGVWMSCCLIRAVKERYEIL